MKRVSVGKSSVSQNFSMYVFQDEEMAMLTEVTHLQEIVHSLCMVADDPESLSSSSENVVFDLIGSKSQPPMPVSV